MDGEVRELMAAQALMSTDRKRDGVDRIEGLLQSRGHHSDWSAAYYAALAAKISLTETNKEQARRLLNLGLKWSPRDEELRYLTRIVNRLDGAEK